MQTEPSGMNMEIDSSHSDESHKKYILNLQKKVRSIYKICINDVITKEMKRKADSIYEIYMKNPLKEEQELRANRENIMKELSRLFDIQPRFKKICEYRHDEFVNSCFTRCDFMMSDYNEDETLNDSKFVINFCGYNLTELHVNQYPHSEIMPLISDNCPSLETLSLEFKVIESEDFKNAFSKMLHLEKLIIDWLCENSTLPETLVNSLEQVGGTLKELSLRSKYNSFLPDSLALVFPKLIALNDLTVYGFRLSEALIQSLDKLINLTKLHLGSPTLNSHSVIDKQINMFPADLKNLKVLCIGWEYNVTDKFLIHLCNKSKKLQHLSITGTNISNSSMLSLNYLSELEDFNLGLKCFGAGTLEKTNEVITDVSVINLRNEKLCHLDISNCTKVSNRSVIKLVEKLENLTTLKIENTQVTIDIVEELSKLKKCRTILLGICVSFDDCNGIFDSLIESHNIQFLSGK